MVTAPNSIQANTTSDPPLGGETAMPYRAPLDWLNFFLADVKGGLGPYIGIFLLT